MATWRVDCRLREVIALVQFTRLEPQTPDIDGEYDAGVECAQIALEPRWFPAVENRGEGVFIQLHAPAVKAWLERQGVKDRLDSLLHGHETWTRNRKSKRPFPGGPYLLLHTLSHPFVSRSETPSFRTESHRETPA